VAVEVMVAAELVAAELVAAELLQPRQPQNPLQLRPPRLNQLQLQLQLPEVAVLLVLVAAQGRLHLHSLEVATGHLLKL